MTFFLKCEPFLPAADSHYTTGENAQEEIIMDKFLPKNEHAIERVVRIVVGIGALSLVFIGPKTLFGLIGIVPLLTGVMGSCPAYTLIGFSTWKASES